MTFSFFFHKIFVQVTQKLFDQAEAHVLAFLETRMFPDYIRFMYQVNDKNIKTAELRRSMR